MKLLEYILPPACVVCGTDLSAKLAPAASFGFRFKYDEPVYHRALCGDCFDKFLPYKLRCQVCGQRNGTGLTCRPCLSETPIGRFLVATPYAQDIVKKTLQSYKYGLVRALALPLGLMLSEVGRAALEASAEKRTIVAVVPLHERRLRWRGFNQAELLADFFARELALERFNLIRRIKSGPALAKVALKQRGSLIKDAFQIIEVPKAAQRVIIIDDVVGSRATLDEVGRAIRRASPGLEIWAATVAG